MIPAIVFLTCVVTTFVAYWFLTRKARREREIINSRLAGALAMPEKDLDKLSVVRPDLMSEMPAANRLLTRWNLAKSLKSMISQAGMRVTVMRLMMLSALTGMIGFALVLFLGDSFLMCAIAGLITASIPFLAVWYKRRERLYKFLVQLPDALDLMSRALSSGHAFTESMQMVSSEMPNPIAGEFLATYEAQKLGLPYKLALRHLTMRIPLLELKLCVTAILIQRETGGNLSEVLSRVAITIRQRFKILEDLNTLTTASRVSAWVLCLLPLGVIALVLFMTPDYLDPLFLDPRGHTMLKVAVAMQVVGMLTIRKIMQIRI
jgi:tight adherence protein B